MKVKTARAIEPNQGIQKKFEKRLIALQASHQRLVMNEIFEALANSALIAHDEKPSDKSKIAQFLEAGAVGAFVDRFVKNNLVRWGRIFLDKAKKLVSWFVKNTASSTSNAQAQALAKAGLPLAKIKKRFGLPVVTHQYLSPTAVKKLPEFIDKITNDFTKISASDIARLQEAIVAGLESGQTLKKIRDTVSTFKGYDSRKINNVTRDVATKVNTEIQRLNAVDLGITKAVWKHVPGRYTSRKSHMEMNGKIFDINEGLLDPALNRLIKPAELPNCRCIMRLIIDED